MICSCCSTAMWIGEYGRLFAKTERLDRRFHRLLNRAFAARQTADYDTDFSTWIASGSTPSLKRSFLNAARDYLDRKDAEGKKARPDDR